jgi:hypothetical protein
MGAGEDIGAAVVYLACREAGYVTGQTLHVSGRMAIPRGSGRPCRSESQSYIAHEIKSSAAR